MKIKWYLCLAVRLNEFIKPFILFIIDHKLIMRNTIYLSLIILGLIVFVGACKEKAAEDQSTPETVTAPAGDAIQNTQPTSVNKEAHFKCTKAGCAGTGEAQGKCPICGSDLAHNQAFHNQAPGSNPPNATTIDPGAGNTITPPPAATEKAPPPAQNAQGVFHFACTKAGCKGGAGAAGKCPVCGSELVHNQAFHNN